MNRHPKRDGMRSAVRFDSDHIVYKTLYWEGGSYTDPHSFPPTVCQIRDLGQNPTVKVHGNQKRIQETDSDRNRADGVLNPQP